MFRQYFGNRSALLFVWVGRFWQGQGQHYSLVAESVIQGFAVGNVRDQTFKEVCGKHTSLVWQGNALNTHLHVSSCTFADTSPYTVPISLIVASTHDIPVHAYDAYIF